MAGGNERERDDTDCPEKVAWPTSLMMSRWCSTQPCDIR